MIEKTDYKMLKEHRKQSFQEFVKTAVWTQYLKPYLEGKIDRFLSIKNIDTKEVEKSYLKNIIKVDVYKDIIFKIEIEWQEDDNGERE